MSAESAAAYEVFWRQYPGFDENDPFRSDVYDPKKHRHRLSTEDTDAPRIYKNIIHAVQPSPVSPDLCASVVPSPTMDMVANNYQLNSGSLIIRKLWPALLICVLERLDPVSLFLARQVCKHFYQAFAKGILSKLPEVDEWGPVTLKREAKKHGYRQRLARYLYTHNTTIFHGRNVLPVCLIPASPASQWLGLIFNYFTKRTLGSIVDDATLYGILAPFRSIHTAVPLAELLGGKAAGKVYGGCCMGCRETYYSPSMQERLLRYRYQGRRHIASSLHCVEGRLMPRPMCLLFEKCHSVFGRKYQLYTTTRPDSEANGGNGGPAEDVDMDRENDNEGGQHEAFDDDEEEEDDDDEGGSGSGSESDSDDEKYSDTDSDDETSQGSSEYSDSDSYDSHYLHDLDEQAHPGEIEEDMYPFRNEYEHSNYYNALNGLICGTHHRHHSRLMFPPKDREAETHFDRKWDATHEDLARRCLLDPDIKTKYLGGKPGSRTHTFTARIFQHRPGDPIRRLQVAKYLRAALQSDAWTLPYAAANTSICAHMRTFGTSLFDKLMLPFEPGVCACFDFDYAADMSVPVAGHGEQYHRHYDRRGKAARDVAALGQHIDDWDNPLARQIYGRTLRHCMPVHELDPVPPAGDDEQDEDDICTDNIESNKCCRCLAVANPVGRQGVFCVDVHYPDDINNQEHIRPIVYPHQYRCMKCATYYSWVRDRTDPTWVSLRCQRFFDSLEHKKRGIYGDLASMDPAALLPKDPAEKENLKHVTWCDHSGDARIDGTERNDNFRPRCLTTALWYTQCERILSDGTRRSEYYAIRKRQIKEREKKLGAT